MRGFVDIPALFWLPGRLFFGLFRPRRSILGTELAGDVEAVGKSVKRFKPGDKVFGATGMRFGAHAEYLCLDEDAAIVKMPRNMSYEEAAAVPVGATTALHFLRKGGIRSGHKVLINGASGGVGAFAVQLAKHFGAEVTGVSSTAKLSLLKSLGADKVIDYTEVNFTQIGRQYDIIFDVAGTTSFLECRRSLKPKGRWLTTITGAMTILQSAWLSLFDGKKVVCGMAQESVDDLTVLKQLIEAGKLRSVIDSRFALAEAREAHRRFETGNNHGSVVITLDPAVG
jgi:2-desacetyl-2-hydroxyethyl bacteriochlorophyllide A dehydrogenase